MWPQSSGNFPASPPPMSPRVWIMPANLLVLTTQRHEDAIVCGQGVPGGNSTAVNFCWWRLTGVRRAREVL